MSSIFTHRNAGLKVGHFLMCDCSILVTKHNRTTPLCLQGSVIDLHGLHVAGECPAFISKLELSSYNEDLPV
jgi:hypothetical protein